MLDETKKYAQPDLTPVIDAYTHALFARYPRDEYYPGLEFGAFIRSICPSLVIALIHKYNSAGSAIVPEALK